MINTKYIIIIDDSGDVWDLANKRFKTEKGLQLVRASSELKSLKQVVLSVPDLVIINEDELKETTIYSLIEYIRKKGEFAITPIILASSNESKEHRVEVLKKGIEFYIKKPLNEEYFYYTVKNVSKLISANRCISALTGLPGNIQIENEMKRRISSRETFAVLYADLDNFKAYNDKYGFMNGDEVIKFTSDIIQDAIQKYGEKGDFLGHIGGDDFVAIVGYENSRKIGRYITKLFDTQILQFYTNEDAERGWIRVPNRKGKLEKYPIMTISVAMISNKYKKYITPLEIGEDGASVKKKAKTVQGSAFLADRRRSRY